MIYDKDIREPLFDFFDEIFGKVRVFEEKPTGTARADILLITEENLIGVEIKSDADSYSRLGRQAREYDKVYTQNIVVVGSTHKQHIFEHVPFYWGVISVEKTSTGQLAFEVLRKEQNNPNVKLNMTLALLWRPELAHLQKLNDMPRYKEKSKYFVISKLALLVPAKISKETLIKQVCETLFERDYTLIPSIIREYKKHNKR